MHLLEKSHVIPVEHRTVRCRVAAHALLRASAEVIAQWRRQPIEFGGEKMSASFFKHAEDQSVAGVTAVLQACANSLPSPHRGPGAGGEGAVPLEGAGSPRDTSSDSPPACGTAPSPPAPLPRWGEGRKCAFADWGVIAAPNLFGRISNAKAIEQYRKEGAWGISPHLIPQQSLHALSGSVSQVLKIHGPNFGVSGGPNAAPDAMLIAATMLADGSLPGLWVILTGHETEWIPNADGSLPAAPACLALALALTQAQPNDAGPHLAIGQAARAELAILPDFHLALLAEEWQNGQRMPVSKWRLSDTQWLEFESILPSEMQP